MINYVQKNYKNGQDVAKSLKQIEKVDLTSVKPDLATSSENDKDEKELEQAGFNIKYQEEL